MKIRLIVSTIFFVVILLYILIDLSISTKKFSYFKTLVPQEIKSSIKKNIFPYGYIRELEKRNSDLESSQNLFFYNRDLKYKNDNSEISFAHDIKNVLINGNKIPLKKFRTRNLNTGIHDYFPGSAYIEVYQEKIFIASPIGIIAYTNISDLDEDKSIKFKQIRNNIDKFVTQSNFEKNYWFTVKDLKIANGKIFLSYTNQVREDCWNTSIIYSKLNFDKLEFKKVFSPDENVCRYDNQDNEFHGHQSGGRIVDFDNENIFLTIGEYRSRYLAQKNESVFGKIVKINVTNGKYSIISKGHRNPQGLFYDKKNKILLETEHGPQGGDEINLIELNTQKVPNYGWPISSYGEYYGGKSETNKKKYKRYPLIKSHIDSGFIEPIKYFTPSIGISEITSISDDKDYVVSSMKEKSLFFFSLDDKNKIQKLDKVYIGERIRDLFFYDKKIFLFLEDTTSIGILKLN